MSESSWRGEQAVETQASPEVVWSVLGDVKGWKHWNAGIERIELEGPFASGTWFTMKPPGQDPLRSQFLEVEENRGFVDETRVGDLVVRVGHRIEAIASGRTRIVYAVDARGPGAAEVGPAVAADFPEVLAALAALAERRRA
jgi:hypothetical protein